MFYDMIKVFYTHTDSVIPPILLISVFILNLPDNDDDKSKHVWGQTTQA
jgi:hypothetical protein